MTAVLDSSTDLQERARQAYRASVADGSPLSREALGARFERSPSWARDRIAEARDTGDTPPATTAIPVVTPVTPTGDTPAVTAPATAVTPAPAVDVAPAAPTKPKPSVAKRPKPVTPPTPTGVTPTVVTDIPAPTPGDTPVVAHRGARVMSRLGFALGSLVSVAGNWLAAWLPAGDNPPGWAPSVASQIGAAVWPVVLLVSIEVLARTPWKPGWYWVLIRVLGGGVVALGSGVISYGHIHEVLLSWGYDRLGAGVGPLVIDGLMVISGFALLAMSNINTRRN